LFVGNLPYQATEDDLRTHFAQVGKPTQIVRPLDRETGRARGFAFVEYAERSEAEAAIKQFDGQLFMGRPLAVSEARAREDRGPADMGDRAPAVSAAAAVVVSAGVVADSAVPARQGPTAARRDRATAKAAIIGRSVTSARRRLRRTRKSRSRRTKRNRAVRSRRSSRAGRLISTTPMRTIRSTSRRTS
jgi:RNA recognition motif-containing protein